MIKKSKGMLNRPNKIIIDNKSSSFYTIIEVFTYDFTGLLFGITNALFKSGLDVWIAKIATNVDQVVDIFYVRDFDGLKIDSPVQMESIKKTIEEMLPNV
jgi:[protein-PII] uridylyltransferase